MANKKASSNTKRSIQHSVVWGVTPSGFKRMGLSYKGKSINLKVNPDDYEYSRGQRAAIYRTQGANVVQQFGADLATITISGTTGWHRDGSGLNGRERLEEINQLILQYQTDTQNGGHSAQALHFNNYTDSKYYVVTVEQGGMKIRRDKSNPLLYNYELHFTVIGGDDTPKQDSSPTGSIGTGAGSSIDKGKEATNPVSTTDSTLVATIINPHATKQAVSNAVSRLKKGHGK